MYVSHELDKADVKFRVYGPQNASLKIITRTNGEIDEYDNSELFFYEPAEVDSLVDALKSLSLAMKAAQRKELDKRQLKIQF